MNMMKQTDNLGQPVLWEDDENGWHTGRIVTTPGVFEPVKLHNSNTLGVDAYLVKESCNGVLTWVHRGRLKKWLVRSEWEEIPVSRG
jgi:hypothetical protein